MSWLSSVRFRLSSVCHGCTVAKRCEPGPSLGLLLITNRKSVTGFQTTSKSLTLDDLEGSTHNGMPIVRHCDLTLSR